MADAADPVESIFAEALAQSDPVRRATLLDSACGNDVDLRARVERLLKRHDDTGSIMTPAAGASGPPSDAMRDGIPNAGTAGLRRPHKLGHEDPPDEQPGSVIGNYKLLQQIGQGGF